MIGTDHINVYKQTYSAKASTSATQKVGDTTFAGAVEKVSTDAAKATGQRKSGHIAESMQKYPQYAKDWQREIENGKKLTSVYPPSKSRDDMTMDEYKSYICSLIGKNHEDPSRSTTETSIHISDEAWETMKDDPDFEGYVLGGIEEVFTFHNPWMSPPRVKRWEVIEIGVPMENYHGSSWGDMSMGANSDAEDMFKTRSKGESYHKKPDPAAVKRVEERQREQKRLKELRDKEWLDDKYEKQMRERNEFERIFRARSDQFGAVPENVSIGMSEAFAAYESMARIW